MPRAFDSSAFSATAFDADGWGPSIPISPTWASTATAPNNTWASTGIISHTWPAKTGSNYAWKDATPAPDNTWTNK